MPYHPDARGSRGGCDAQFSIDREQLGYATDESAGEFIYDTIFATPMDCVVQRLKKYDRRQKLWLDLPKPIDCCG